MEQVATVVVPGFETLDAGQREAFRSIIDEALRDRPTAVRRQLAVFLRLLDLAPVARWGRRLGALRPERARRALEWFQEAPVDRLRKGFWGLKALVFMGYYGQPELWPEVGYAPLHDAREKLDG